MTLVSRSSTLYQGLSSSCGVEKRKAWIYEVSLNAMSRSRLSAETESKDWPIAQGSVAPSIPPRVPAVPQHTQPLIPPRAPAVPQPTQPPVPPMPPASWPNFAATRLGYSRNPNSRNLAESRARTSSRKNSKSFILQTCYLI